MKEIIIFFCCLIFSKSYSQNIESKIVDYSKSINNIEYSTYHYVNASYSYSRPQIVLLTNREIFMKMHQKIPLLFSSKQEYTDVYILGMQNYNNITNETDQKIINVFVTSIIKYRNDNNLPSISEQSILSEIKYINEEIDLSKFFVLKKSKKFK
jgi:hypothetical protein